MRRYIDASDVVHAVSEVDTGYLAPVYEWWTRCNLVTQISGVRILDDVNLVVTCLQCARYPHDMG